MMLQPILALIFTFVISPIWPLGQNPLPGDPFIIVNKQSNQVAYIDDNRIQMIAAAGTGRTEELTPEGMFTVTVKAVNPYFRKLDILGGDPENPLGSRWIGFDAENTDGRIFGLHGTNQPQTVGHYVSNGCIRLHNEVIESFFDSIPIGTKVLIVKTERGFWDLAKEYGAVQ